MAMVVRKLHKTIFDPIITGSLLLTLSGPASLITGLRWANALGLASKVNQALNSWALNNWQWKTKKQWVWNREVAVVTGGCSGIGLEVVRGLMRKGIKVAIFDIQPLPKSLENCRYLLSSPNFSGYDRKANFNRTRNERGMIRLTGEPDANIKYFYCDVTSQSSIAEAAHALRLKWGDATVLVNNAGICSPHSLLDTPNDWVAKLFTINIVCHFWLVKEFMPTMIEKNKGHIVGIASMASFISPPGIVDYAATKAAVQALHEGSSRPSRY